MFSLQRSILNYRFGNSVSKLERPLEVVAKDHVQGEGSYYVCLQSYKPKSDIPMMTPAIPKKNGQLPDTVLLTPPG